MNILILIPPIENYNNSSRFTHFANIILKYFKNNKEVECVTDYLSPKITSPYSDDYLCHYKYPIVDHTIIIDDKGVQSRSKKFLEKIRKCTRGYICTICTYAKSNGGEDFTFYLLDPIIKFNKAVYLNKPVDTELLLPSSNMTNGLKILVSGNLSNVEDKTDISKHTIEQAIFLAIQMKFQKQILIKEATQGGFKVYNVATQEVIMQQIDNIRELYNEYSTTSILFVTSKHYNKYLLYELSACNALIVMKKQFIDPLTEKELDILTYDEEIPWEAIFEKQLTHSSRKKILENGNNWISALQTIFKHLSNCTNYKTIEPEVVPVKSSCDFNFNKFDMKKPDVTRNLIQKMNEMNGQAIISKDKEGDKPTVHKKTNDPRIKSRTMTQKQILNILK